MRTFEIGERAERTRAFTAAEIHEHEALTGDLAVEPGTVPVGLLGGMVSELLGTKLPGRGTNWLKQKYDFINACRADEAITTSVEITRVRPDKALINLASRGVTAGGRVIFHGESLVLVRELE